MQTAVITDACVSSETAVQSSLKEVKGSGSFAVPGRVGEARSDDVFLSLVLPTYNEGKNIERIVRILDDLLSEAMPNSYELIVVDDNSPDGTWEIAQNLCDEIENLKVIRREDERGLSSAVIRGWQSAEGNVLGVIDADLQHPPEVLTRLVDSIASGEPDLVMASRHVPGGGVSDWAIHRRVISRGAQLLGLFILPEVIFRVSDPMSGFFLVRRDAIAGVELKPRGYKILIDVLARGEIRKTDEVAYVFQERQEGESKLTNKVYLDYVTQLIQLRFSRRRNTLAWKWLSTPPFLLDVED